MQDKTAELSHFKNGRIVSFLKTAEMSVHHMRACFVYMSIELSTTVNSIEFILQSGKYSGFLVNIVFSHDYLYQKLQTGKILCKVGTYCAAHNGPRAPLFAFNFSFQTLQLLCSVVK